MPIIDNIIKQEHIVIKRENIHYANRNNVVHPSVTGQETEIDISHF